MFVTVRVVTNAETTSAFRDLLKTGLRYGLKLERVRSPANNLRPRPWYSAEVVDPGAARQFLSAVKDSPAVDAAYLKPADALP